VDVVHLARALRGLAKKGNAVLVIEHHTDLLAMSDHLIELGPEGGAAGGLIVASGTPAELAANPASITGPWLQSGRASGGAFAQSPAAKKKASKGKSTAGVTKKAASKKKVSKKKVSKKAPAKQKAKATTVKKGPQ
jgi:excinuclease ABC subunit A